MIVVAFLAVFSFVLWLSVFGANDTKKFYRDHTKQMSASITFIRQTSVMGERAYELTVLAENSFSYKITTKKRAAAKYKTGSKVDIIVPDEAEPETEDLFMENLELKEASGEISSDEAEVLEVLRGLKAVSSKLGTSALPQEKRVILKSEENSRFLMLINAAAASVFSIASVFMLIALIAGKI